MEGDLRATEASVLLGPLLDGGVLVLAAPAAGEFAAAFADGWLRWLE